VRGAGVGYAGPAPGVDGAGGAGGVVGAVVAAIAEAMLCSPWVSMSTAPATDPATDIPEDMVRTPAVTAWAVQLATLVPPVQNMFRGQSAQLPLEP